MHLCLNLTLRENTQSNSILADSKSSHKNTSTKVETPVVNNTYVQKASKASLKLKPVGEWTKEQVYPHLPWEIQQSNPSQRMKSGSS